MTIGSQKYLNLSTSVQFVKGVGPKRAELLARVDVETIGSLVNYFPRRYLDRSRIARIREVQVGQDVTVVGKILSCGVKRGRRSRFIVKIGDETGILYCVWFQGLSYASRAFRVGETVAFSGKVTYYGGPQLVHPEYDKLSEKGENDPLHTGRIIPMYPSTETLSGSGLDSRGFRRIIRDLLNSVSHMIPETLPEDILRDINLIPRSTALKNIHFPNDWKVLNEARKRLKFEELFYLQFYLALQRKQREVNQKGIVFERVGELTQKLIKKLPFELTAAQKRVLREIRMDMKSVRAMNRLLQGDVGSGKTVVASIAMLIAVENGYQAALMVPTEILAEQHFLTTSGWLENMGVRVALLKGGQKGSERDAILSGLEKGEIHIAVGTHALIQEGVNFKKLGFVVIDEQHRFGVIQRASLRQKGIYPDVLVMTATPIPRTLALTLYGDLDISVLDEMPGGRKPVQTVWRKENKRSAIYDFLKKEIDQGRQVYVVYPLVEESEKIDLAAATEGYQILCQKVFPEYRLALLHGRMKSEEKAEVMRVFQSGETDILVCTTVIEVGVDVTNATAMLLEHSERFGLTQMHQLRGRIGRGHEQSTCILLTQGKLTDEAQKRIQTMVETTDGFKIAEKDLELRGPGELIGTRQHGGLNLKIADLLTDSTILDSARKEAFRVVEEDYKLENPEYQMIKSTYKERCMGRFNLIDVG
jgi:ATP-dependent DNA helicase RecG